MGRHSKPRRATRAWALAGMAGLVAVPAPGFAAAEDQAGTSSLIPGTPCTVTAKACVDLDGQEAWLVDEGEVVRGPVPISSGGSGNETPTGDFRVEWKHDDHISGEFGSPMPYSVFFAEGGIAFHEGPLDHPSAGCVRLAHEDAVAFFDQLAVGDEVQVR
ncbi:L,D-transpeptidase [Pseudonocardia bannensis]|uniref:L,D-transpeptidase n=1 Tax=Pseudonocardia bannensis TaxID=630973 RepID=A0A848DRQ9_9PSEU|nr:L,D-transpeptidase [Pseudonocardia bannensis]NMH95193.1 L,D-transpeptidase [Pseudonocardia bannensis]